MSLDDAVPGLPGPRARREVPTIGTVVRTPESRFEGITEYSWPRHEMAVGPGLRMAYVDAGPSDATETVLLLHGEPMWGYLYRTMIPTLVANGCRVVVPDLIGFGRSDKPTDAAAYTYSNHVAWVRDLVERLDLRGVTFFGQDWGGLIGGRVVAELPDRFARLVFSNTGLPRSGPGVPFIRAQERLDPAMIKDTMGIDWRATLDADDRIVPERVAEFVDSGSGFYFLSWRLYAQEIEELTPSKIVPGWCRSTLTAEALAAYDAPYPTQEYAAGAHRFPMLVPITIDDAERLKGDAAWEVLGGFERPVLTIWGAQCPFTYAEGGKQFRDGIPGARLPGIEHKAYEASHFIQEDRGPEVAADIVAFIQHFPQ